jgi:hypothetical protein
MNKQQARHVRDLQPFVGTMTIAYRKGALNEASPLSRRPDFVPIPQIPYLGMARFRRNRAVYGGTPSRREHLY